MQAPSNSVPEIFSETIVAAMEWHDRLNIALRDKNWTVPDLAREIGEPGDEAVLNRLYKYTSGEVKNPRGNWMARLAAAIGETEGYLRFGVRPGQINVGQEATLATGPRVIRPAGPEISEVEKVSEGWPDVGDDWIDVRGVTVGGDDSYFFFGDVIDQVRRPPGIKNAKNVAALNVAGESMIPRYFPGELIYVQQREPAPGDHVVVEMYAETENEAPKSFLKVLRRRTGRRLYCEQYNPAGNIEFDAGEVKTVWRVLTLRDLLG